MKMITAIIRPEKLEDVKAALFKAEVEGLTISRVSGHGGEKTVLESYRGHPLVYEFHDKIRFDIGVSEPFVEVTIEAIVRAARTGQVGDGKIFVTPVERVVRIRTGELDRDAVTPVHVVQKKLASRRTSVSAGPSPEGPLKGVFPMIAHPHDALFASGRSDGRRGRPRCRPGAGAQDPPAPAPTPAAVPAPAPSPGTKRSP